MFFLKIRWDLIEVLIEEGLKPDFFSFPMNFNSAVADELRGLGYKWLTPLSFVLSYSPFNDICLETVKLLVRKG